MEGRPFIIRVAQGSIIKMKTRAIVLGHSQGMAPGVAERTVDEVLEGAVSGFLEDRSLKGDLGDFFAIPTSLASLPAETVIIMGMGPPDLFTKRAVTEKDSASNLYQIAYRLIKGLLATDIIQFATVPIGAGRAGLPVHSVVKEYVVGICRALLDLDCERKINEFAIVEVDATKLNGIQRGLEEASQELQGQFVFDIRKIKLPEVPQSGTAPPLLKTTLLSARRRGRELTYSVFNERPVQLMKSAEIDDNTLRQLKEELMVYLKTGQGAEDLKDTAQVFYELMVPPEIRKVVRHYAEREALILNLETPLTLIPWELCYDREAEAFLGEYLLGRQIMREETYRLQARSGKEEPGLDVLILANLSGDLPQAEEEGRMLKEYLERPHDNQGHLVRVNLCTAKDLLADKKKSQILKLVYQGRYEIVHYCGHAFYDCIDPHKSGWVIDERMREVIRAYEFSNLPQPPVLVFSNACESASMDNGDRLTEQEFAHSLAGAFIRAGVDLYIGNLVKVSDASARVFAENFYDVFFRERCTIGEALSRARRKLMDDCNLKDPTWANYVLYGSPAFCL